MTLGRTIDHPDFAGVTAQIFAHFLEARAIQEAGNRDEARYPISIVLGFSGCIMPAGAEDLQRRPPPEINVEVLKVMCMGSCPPFWRWRPAVHRRYPPGTPPFDPTALPVGMILIGRVSDDYGYWLCLLNCISVATRL